MRIRLAVFILLAAVGCRSAKNLPPAEQIMHPGPGVDGPGPGVMMWGEPVQTMSTMASQIAFVGPEGAQVTWDVTAPGQFDAEPLVCPARYNFPQGAIYRLKLTNLPGRPGVELYPTLEVGPSMPRTEAYLAHNAIPVQFTEEDFDQVQTGNFVTKVIYLPDAEYQDLAIAGVETLVSTRLDPGVDPIVEADRRGAIMAIIRVGNKDLTAPGAEMINQGLYPGAGGAGGAGGDGNCGPGGMGAAGGPGGGMPAGLPGNVAGMTAPMYGMPMSGTPIGLPGPPHIPLGSGAGLQKHVIKNHTSVHIPHPTRKFMVHVKQKPGMSYPRPVNTVRITERSDSSPTRLRQPDCDREQLVR